MSCLIWLSYRHDPNVNESILSKKKHVYLPPVSVPSAQKMTQYPPKWFNSLDTNFTVRAKILARFQFEGKNDVWIIQLKRVKKIGWHWTILKITLKPSLLQVTIQMSHWCNLIVDGAEFLISHQRLAILSKFSYWKLIQYLGRLI